LAAQDQELVQATHILTMDISRPREDGLFPVGVRLTDVQSAKTVWAEAGVREKPGSAPDTLAGTYYHASERGDTVISVAEGSDGTVTVGLVKGPMLTEFNLKGQLRGNLVDVESCHILYKEDPQRKFVAVKATMKILNEQEIKIETQTVQFGKGKMPSLAGREFIPFTFKRVQPSHDTMPARK
jgi:hypothetical protein